MQADTETTIEKRETDKPKNVNLFRGTEDWFEE